MTDSWPDIDPDLNILDLYNNNCDYYTIDTFNEIPNSNLFNLSLLNYNIRSFATNGNCFEVLLDSFQSLPNFLVLSETWNSPTNVSICNLEGYHVFIHTEHHHVAGVSRFFVRMILI